MSAVSQPYPPVPPRVIAALLLLARIHLRRLELPHPTSKAIIETTGATRSRAYELQDDLAARLPDLARPAGRPAAQPPAPASDHTALTRSVLTWMMNHPGCVSGSPGRREYAEVFRHYVIEQREAHPQLDNASFADAVCVPRGTLEDWLRSGCAEADPPDTPSAEHDTDHAGSARIQSILDAYAPWRGPFTAFCEHVRRHLRIDYGNTLIARILYTYGERRPKRRPGRSPDECATRESFEVFFSGAQWVGDGMQVPVEINDTHFTFNLELNIDAYSGAVVGASVRDEEDSAAVVEDFVDGVSTTSTQPLALLLDWRPSNHTETVDDALGDTIRMRATQGRAQNKAHVEGAFGLFSQSAPPLRVRAQSLHDLAKALLELRVTTWARALNHRPRADRGGRSRVDIYHRAQPTNEQIAEARRALEERVHKAEKMKATQEARADPVVRRALDAAFARLELVDPGEHIRIAIATYPRDAALDGSAIFEGKKTAGTLPQDVDARYLLGIVRNLTHIHEADYITESLIRERLDARDHLLAGLEHDRESTVAASSTPTEALRAMVDRALAAGRTVDRLFWLGAISALLTAQPPEQHPNLFRGVARRIHNSFAVPRRQRQAAERIVARHVWPVS